MTGDSHDDVGTPGGSPVPLDAPRPDGENSSRPFRAWSSAYQPPTPSLWSRIKGWFARKPSDAAEEPNQLLADAVSLDEEQTAAVVSDEDAVVTADEEPVAAADETAPDIDPRFTPSKYEGDDEPLDASRDLEPPPPPPEPLSPEAFEAISNEQAALRYSGVGDVEPVVDEQPEMLEIAPDVEEEAEEETEEEAQEEEEAAAATSAPDHSDSALEFLDVDEPKEPEGELEPVADSDSESVSGIEPKRGFFARLFSRRSKEPLPEPEATVAEEIVAEEIVAEEIVAEEELAAEGFEPFAPVESVDQPEPVESVDEVEWLDHVEAPAEEVEPEIPAFLQESATPTQPARDPAFFYPEDEPETAHAETPSSPTLDDALPRDPLLPPPFTGEVTQPWPDDGVDGEPVVERKPGFFARLFGRKSQAAEQVQEPQPEELEVAGEHDPEIVAQVEEAFASADDAFRTDDAEAAEPETVEPSFASVDEALPSIEPEPAVFETFDEPVQAGETEDAEPIAPIAPEAPEYPDIPRGKPARHPTYANEMLFGDTIDPRDIQPSFDSPTMEEIDSRPTIETTARATVPAAAVDDESTDEFVQPVPPEVDAAAEAERPPFFVPKFRSFYNEIVLYKHQKSQFTGGFATAIVDYTSDLTPDAAAQGLSKRLTEILELQHAEAMWMGGEAAARYPDAQYAMAVLADELFTHMEWPGQEAWSKYLLEPRMFKTHAAEVEFFKRVDKLLKNEADHPSRAARDLARMYLLVLASGFRGKYRLPNLHRPLAEYRRRLYEYVYENDPLMLYSEDRRIFPEATERTLESRAVSRFSGLQQWAAALIIILVGYTLLANFAWKRVSADLADVTARVEAANRTSNAGGSWMSAGGVGGRDSLP